MDASGQRFRLVWQLGGLAAVALAICAHYPQLLAAIVFAVYSLILVALTIAATVYVQHLWNAPRAAVPTYYPPDLLLSVTRLPQFDLPRPRRLTGPLPILFGRTVDGLLLQILDNTLRDFITPWLRPLTRHWRLHGELLREDLWLGVQRLKERCLRVDAARLLAVDMTVRCTVHLEKIRIAQARAQQSGGAAKISVSAYLANENHELEFLRRLCEIAAIYLLPRGYSLNPLRLMLSEVLALKCLLPLVQLVTSADFVNQKVVQYIEARLAAAALNKRTHEYAASFEEFVRIIAASQSTDELLLMRTSCVNDIIAATAQQSLQTAQIQAAMGNFDTASSGSGDSGITASSGPTSASSSTTSASSNHHPDHPIDPSKRKQLAKLRRYIQQLQYAKSQCEKRLARLGWTGGYTNELNLAIADVLATVVGRRQFGLFLEPLQASGLIGFHSAVEELKTATRGAYHQLGSEIYYAYIRAPAPAHVKVEPAVRRRMEAFLLGDQGPEVFYEAQQEVLAELEDKYYATFVLSPEYAELRRLLAEAEAEEAGDGGGGSGPEIATDAQADEAEEKSEAEAVATGNGTPAATLDVSNHSTYARTKLDQLQERLDNKAHALAALRASLRPESKLLGILGKEVDWLRMEKRQLEAHLRRTELWAEHLGWWRAAVQSVEVPADDKDGPQFMIVVQVDEREEERRRKEAANGESGGVKTASVASGWVVLRSLAEFQELHKRLRPLCAGLKALELPTMAFKLFFVKSDRGSLEKAKGQIQRYLNFILEEDRLYPSEAIYTFLSPSSDNLKQSVVPVKKKFSLLTLFKNNGDLSAAQQQAHQQQQRANDPFWGPCGARSDGGADISLLLEGASAASGSTDSNSSASDRTSSNSANSDTASTGSGGSVDSAKDSIAEPLYSLMGEIFDMGGLFKWLRRSLISFVQITYGRTINRQIRDWAAAAFEEPQLHYYASTALKAFWPGGVLAGAWPERTQDQREMTARAAQQLLLDNVPEVMCSLVGAQTARLGTEKVWQAVQTSEWNKQLFYELLEILMVELFPEIRQLKEPLGSARSPNTKATPTKS